MIKPFIESMRMETTYPAVNMPLGASAMPILGVWRLFWPSTGPVLVCNGMSQCNPSIYRHPFSDQLFSLIPISLHVNILQKINFTYCD